MRKLYIFGIAFFYLIISGLAFVFKNEIYTAVIVTLDVLSAIGFIVLFFILNKKPSEIFEQKGKEVNYQEAMELGHELIGKRYHDYIHEIDFQGVVTYGDYPASPIYCMTGKSFWKPDRYYFFGVNGKQAERLVAIHTSKSSFDIKSEEVRKIIINSLTERPERIEEITQEPSFNPATGMTTQKLKIRRMSREQHDKEQEIKREQSKDILETPNQENVA